MRVRPKDRTSWRRWFAWHPVIIDNVTVWLEIVERKRDPDIFDWVYSYRTIERTITEDSFASRSLRFGEGCAIFGEPDIIAHS